MEVEGRRFKVNLVCLPLEGLDVILGMNWLSINHAVIDYGRRKIVFPEAEGIGLVSTQEVLREVIEGATCFMIVAHTKKVSTEEQISRIPVVDEYTDIFPDEIPSFHPAGI